MKNHTEQHGRTFRTLLILMGAAIALGIGIALVSPAIGATLYQSDGGSITGAVTVNGAPAVGVAVELRQRSNDGADTSLSTAKSDSTGTYHFTSQPSAPNDAFYYVHLTGGKGMLAVWNTFPIIYVHGSDFNVPGVEMGDVEITGPAQSAAMSLPGNLQWKARRSGETYRVFIYAKGKTDKPALDSGSLGTSAQFAIVEGALPEGAYEAVVQVRDAVVGYGQSQARLLFTIGKAAAQPAERTNPPATPERAAQDTPAVAASTPAAAASTPAAVAPTAVPVISSVAPTAAAVSPPGEGTEQAGSEGAAQQPKASAPEIQVKLSANKTNVGQGESMVYTIKVTNAGSNAAEAVVVTDRLPAGLTIDAYRAKSTTGSLSIDGNVVTAQVGNLAPNEEAAIEIPVKVATGATGSLSNQASAQYKGASDPVQSNAYIAQVAEPLTGPAPAQNSEQPAAPAQQPAVKPPAKELAPPAVSNPKVPAVKPPASQPQTKPAAPQAQATAQPVAKQPAAAMPQTGGSFPVVLAVLLALATLLARYLRGLRHRRV